MVDADDDVAGALLARAASFRRALRARVDAGDEVVLAERRKPRCQSGLTR